MRLPIEEYSTANLFFAQYIQPYPVTKAAQIHLNKILAKISGPEIRVNSVCPGILLTVSTKHSSLCLEHALCGEGKLLCETPC